MNEPRVFTVVKFDVPYALGVWRSVEITFANDFAADVATVLHGVATKIGEAS